ncbi:MAG TPA: GDP-mannose 4,6-dehydratase, partial [Gemmatimonadaceae bacterium]|nr:GDP-mannose 4,6-dehydratase [Gemmatimonadaceae bacterium]
DAQLANFSNLTRLGIRERVRLSSMSVTDFRSVLQVLLRVKPTELYNLSGQSSVGLSFDQPVETLESVATGTLNLLETIRFSGLPVRLYSAGSGEVYGDTHGFPANEELRFAPRSPYAVAKAAAYWQVANYREAYRLYACTGILFNHESPLRPERYVTRKIVASACRIKGGSKERLMLGNINVSRDWGWAPEYVEAMWLMLQQPNADDFVVATGTTHTLAEFVDATFSYLGLDWHEHVESDASLYRPTDITLATADPSKAQAQLGWKATKKMSDVVRLMVDAEKTSGAADRTDSSRDGKKSAATERTGRGAKRTQR